jgi:thiol-disulfide isomerase/thioredoxin
MAKLERPRGRAGSRPVVRYGIIAAVLAVIVTAGVLAVENLGGSPTFAFMNVPAPRFTLPGIVPGSTGISPASFEGQAVVLNFWGSWCPPCRAEMPALQAAHRALGDQVTFIGIDEDDTRSSAIAFLRHVGVTYAIGFDGNGVASRAFELDETPTTYFISHGEELTLNIGELSAATLRSYLKEAFGIRWSSARAATARA